MAFTYPRSQHVRRYGPRGYHEYQSYKPWLRDEFDFRCVYLAARPRTVHEVWQKLRRRGVADQVTAQVIARLQARGLLDDTAYAHAYLPARLASRGYGPQRLRRELQQRGIGRALVEEAVQQDLAVEDVLAAARRQAAKRWPRLARVPDRVARRQKLWAFLCRRGFPAAIVQQVLMETIEEAATGGEADPLNSSTSSSDLSPSPLETG